MSSTSRRARGTAAAVGLGAVLAAASLAPADAASHREAPLTAQDPVADNTDTYAFVSPNDPTKVTLIANFVPFQDPFGGPNYFFFGDDVRYDINVDNDGDAMADITYEFRFTTTDAAPNLPLYTGAQITSLEDDWNRKQTYSITVVRDGVRENLVSNAPVPPYNVGPRTTPDYPALAEAAVTEIPGGISSFAGPRDEVFSADLGAIFDLGGLRPLNSAHAVGELPDQVGVDSLDGKNIHSIALEVPIDVLTEDDPTIGVWSTANRKKVRVFAQNSGATPVNRGRWVQVSRLGNPLVNEVVIPISLKDAFNSLRPDQDAGVLAGLEVEPATEGAIPLVTDPILADLIEQLYEPSGIETPPDGSRDDLVQIFLTGIPGLNDQVGDVAAEMLRLNTSTPTTDEPNPLGVIGGDEAGFPNGRRLGDDVVDISLRAVAGGTALTPDYNVFPNNALTDGVGENDMPLLAEFPFIPHPHSGYDTGPLQGDIPNNGVDDSGPTG